MDDWMKNRMAELEAAAPIKRKKKAEPFVKVPLWWATAAAKATRTTKAPVWMRLLHLAWKGQQRTFCLPNGWLAEQGVSRFTKNRALKELEAAGLITIERRRRKSPRVTVPWS
jgi:hypothetical protein